MSSAPQIFPTSGAHWPEQKDALEKRIADLHVELEGVETIEQCAFVQGQIAFARWIITGAEPSRVKGTGRAKYG